MLIGAALLTVALFSRAFCWHTAITVTYCTFALDFLKNRSELPAPALWAFVIGTTLATVIYTASGARMRPLFLFLIFSSLLVALLKGFFLPMRGIQIQLLTTELTFVALAIPAVLLTPGPSPHR